MFRKAIRFIIILNLILSIPATYVFSDDEPSAVNLGQILVQEKEMTLASQESTVIPQRRIERAQESRTADGLFENTAGIDLQRKSLGGNTGSEVILRGFDESRYLVLLDGRPLNGAGVYGGNYVDWASLSTDDIEKVVVTRGTESAEYGNSLGGIINIKTKRGTEKPRINIRSSYGSYNTTDAAVSLSGSFSKFVNASFTYGYWRTDGYLRNNFNNRNNFSGKVGLVLPGDLTIDVGARYTVQERGFVVENREGAAYFNAFLPESSEDIGAGPFLQYWGAPGPFGPVRPKMYWGDGSYWKDRRGQYDISLEKQFEDLNIKATMYMNKEERKEYYYAIDNSSKLVLMRYSEPEDSWGWFVKAVQTVGKHIIKYGFEGKYLGYGGIEIPYTDAAYFRILPTPSEGSPQASDLNSAYVQGFWAVSPQIDINVGLRYDSYISRQATYQYEEGLSPKIGIVCKPWKDVRVFGSFGQAYRFPTCPEAYWYFAGYQPPDRKTLTPERAIQGEFGLSKDFANKAKVEARGYYYYVYDYIRTIFGYRPSRVVYNIDEVMLSGFEIEAEYPILKDLNAFANYSFQVTTKKGDILDSTSALSDSLAELPENKMNAGIRHSWLGLTTEFVMRYVSKRHELTGSALGSDASDLSALNRFATFDLNFRYKILKGKKYSGTVQFNIENLFGARYEETSGFPMPGRTLTGGMNIKF